MTLHIVSIITLITLHIFRMTLLCHFSMIYPGGHHPSMIDSMKNAILASKALSLPKSSHDNVGLPLTVHDVLYLATLGSAAICGLHDTIGNFLPGKDFDAVLVDLRQFHEQLGIESAQDVTYDHHKHALEQHEAFVDGNIDLWQHDDLMSCVERFVYLGDDRNVKKVWVRGRLVKGSYD